VSAAHVPFSPSNVKPPVAAPRCSYTHVVAICDVLEAAMQSLPYHTPPGEIQAALLGVCIEAVAEISRMPILAKRPPRQGTTLH